jgi:hypothetical protein
VGLALGWLDLVTWGDWFHSFRAYVNFNVLSGQAVAQFGALPWWYYLQRIVFAPWALIGFVVWRQRPTERVWLFLVAALGYFAIVSSTPHKEDRFLYPTLVLLSIAGVPAFVGLVAQYRTSRVLQLWAAAALLGGAAFYVFPSPWEPQRKEQFQLEVKASRGATGLVMMNEGMWGSGGFFYVGKNLPWCQCDFPADQCFQMAARDPRVNRGLYWANSLGDTARNESSIAAFEAAGFRLVEQRGQASYFER